MKSEKSHSLASDLILAHLMAKAAAEIALLHFRSGIKSDLKRDGTPVTHVDLAVENALRDILVRECPDDAILGEEFGQTEGSERRWILDPIDGTSEFIAGTDHWGTHIALEENGVLILGLISRPSLNRIWWATKGGGAYHAPASNLAKFNPIVLSSTRELSQSKVTIWERTPTERVKILQEMGIWVTPSLSNIIDLLEGHIDAFVDVIGKPWDHAPVAMIIEEAGGRFQDHQGGRRIDIGEVRYTNGKIDQAFYRTLSNG